MKMRNFLNRVEHEHVVAAIRQAEQRTSGEIRVMVSRQSADDPVLAAEDTFARLRMHETRDRNGVLIWVSPHAQAYAIVGDEQIHARCGQKFWDELAAVMAEHFKGGNFTEALVLGIHRAGDLLAEHFPRRPDDSNELPDKVLEE